MSLHLELSVSRLSYLCTTVHPSFVKLVRIITRLIQAYQAITRRRSTPSPTPTITSLHIPPRTPSPPAPSTFPISPVSSTTTLDQPSEGSTVGHNDYLEAPLYIDTPEWLDNDLPEEDRIQGEDIEELDAEEQEVEGIRAQIRRESLFYLELQDRFGENGEVPGTGGWTVRDFFWVYLAAVHANPLPAPSIYSERDLLGDSSSDDESYGAPEEQDFSISTIPLVHPSAGQTPAHSNTSLNGGEDTPPQSSA